MSKEALRKAIASIAIQAVKKNNPVLAQWCKVKSVTGYYCDVTIGDDEDFIIHDILLGYNKSDCFVKPTVGKMVFVVFTTKTTGVALLAEQSDEMKLMGDNYGGIPKAESITNKLNALETQENAFKTIVSAILAAGVSSPTTPVTNATLAALFTSFNITPITPTVQINLENEKIKHGNGG